MKFSEWVKPNTVAILCTAIYYGVPSQGHKNCYKAIEHGPAVQVTHEARAIEKLHCIECGKPLLIPIASQK